MKETLNRRNFLTLTVLALAGCEKSEKLEERVEENSMTMKERPPIIDMHLHSHRASPGAIIEREGIDPSALSFQPDKIAAPPTDDQLMRETMKMLKRYNIVKAVASGPMIDMWKEFDRERIISGYFMWEEDFKNPENIEIIRKRYHSGKLDVIGELVPQSAGISPGDELLDPYYSLAEEFDIPVGIHTGPCGSPGAPYETSQRAWLMNPLLLEDALTRHPKLRIYVMHAGWPMLDEMVALMYYYPNVYVDVAATNWLPPRKEFHSYLKRLVDAGYGKRIMFGSDNMFWPELIRISIEGVESADFLTEEQKRDIFYNNAVRFLHLEEKSDDE